MEAIYPVLLDKPLNDEQLQAVVASAEGYSFPTNLDTDPPLGGLVPKHSSSCCLKRYNKVVRLKSLFGNWQITREQEKSLAAHMWQAWRNLLTCGLRHAKASWIIKCCGLVCRVASQTNMFLLLLLVQKSPGQRSVKCQQRPLITL
jgi:hypothetical protein